MNTKHLTHRPLHSRILIFAVPLLGGLALMLGLLWLLGGEATPVTAAPAPNRSPSPSKDIVAKPMYLPLQASGWTTATPITVYNSGSVLADFQISLTIPYATGMQADFDDLRFGDSDGNCLSYWVETYTQNISATVWVKLPSIPIPTTTISMYYGNPAALPASDGDATFEFFDDFAGASLDTTKWDDSNSPRYSGNNGDYKLENGHLKMWGNWGGNCSANGVYERINTQVPLDKPFVVESKFMVGGTSNQLSGCCNICYHTIFANQDVIGVSNSTGSQPYGFVFRIDGTPNTNYSLFPDQYKWHRITKSFEPTRLAVRTDYTTTEYSFAGTGASSGPIGLAGDTDLRGTAGSAGSDFVDWIAIRKFASTAPTTTLGSPVQVPDLIVTKSATPTVPNPGGPITYTITFTNDGAIAANNVVITDHVPVSVTNPNETSPNCSMGAIVNARVGITFAWDVAILGVDEVCVITITGQLSGTLPGGHVFDNKVTITAAEDDSPCNNRDAVSVTVNYAPVAAADAAPRDIGLCNTGTLDGSGSGDPDGHLPLSYHWERTGGPATIDDPFAATTVFTVSCSTPGVVTFTLTVTDNLGLASTPDNVIVTVEDVPVAGLAAFNSSPAPINSTVRFTATITDGSSVTYTWNFGDGHIGYSNDIDHASYINHVYAYGGALTYTVVVTASNGFTTTVYTTYTDTATTTVTLITGWPISGTVWDDTNDNSAFDPGEVISGLANVRMFLYKEYSGCVASTLTNNNGVYTFTGVISGDYQVIEACGSSNPMGLGSLATFAATEVMTPCNQRDRAADPPGYASNTPNVQWITLNDGGSIDNRAYPDSLWPASLTSVDFGDEQAKSFSACEDAFQTKGGSVGSINLFKLDVPNATLDIYPAGNTTVYHDINSIGFNEVDNLIYGYRRDQDRFTRIDEEGTWTELTATDGFVTYDSYLGDVTGQGCRWGEGYWVLGSGGDTDLKIVDVDPSRPTYLTVVNTVTMNSVLVGADIAWNRVNDKFYVYNADALYEIEFDGALDDQATGAIRSSVATMDIPGGGAGAQYFDREGGFYFYVNNTGELWKISNVQDIVAVSLVTPTRVATGSTVGLNDGAGCAPVVEFEFGDAPASYEPASPARHNFIFEDGFYLGSHQDGELGAQSSADALGDDNDGEDDDDGVTREGADWYDQALWANSEQFYTLTIYANKAGYLNAWINLNPVQDNDWDDPGEQIATDFPLNAGINYAPPFSVTDNSTGTTYMRFRFTDEISDPVEIGGVVVRGEVEDYLITIDGCADLSLAKTVVPTRPVYGGEIITFTVVVTNNGKSDVAGCDDDASNVEVTDPLPSGYTYESHDASHGVYSHTTGIWDIGTITHGTAVTLDIVAQVGGGDLENVAEVTDSGAFDPDSTPDNDRPEEDDQDSAAVVILPIGGTVYPVNKVALLAPWIAWAAITVVIGGGTLLVKRRRARQR